MKIKKWQNYILRYIRLLINDKNVLKTILTLIRIKLKYILRTNNKPLEIKYNYVNKEDFGFNIIFLENRAKDYGNVILKS